MFEKKFVSDIMEFSPFIDQLKNIKFQWGKLRLTWEVVV